MNITQLPRGRYRKSLKFNEGYLHFVESRSRHRDSQAPCSTAVGRVFSEPAKLLVQAKAQDADSYDRLINHCADIVLNHALREGWKMDQGRAVDRDRAKGLSELAAYPFVHGESLDDSKSARYLGVSRSVWLNRWQSRMLAVRWWVERWNREGQPR